LASRIRYNGGEAYYQMGDIMAQRLVTEYKRAHLKLTATDFNGLILFLKEQGIDPPVKVYENGDREIFIHQGTEDIPLSFQYSRGALECYDSFCIYNLRLTSVINKAMKLFKGSAEVHRRYYGFTMIYYYEFGIVAKIVEKRLDYEKVIYEYKNFNENLEWLYRSQEAEKEIAEIKRKVNSLLDKRNRTNCCEEIDQLLIELSHQLYMLEA
jgi:hypothetical protein